MLKKIKNLKFLNLKNVKNVSNVKNDNEKISGIEMADLSKSSIVNKDRQVYLMRKH